jgi:hypothetical protein
MDELLSGGAEMLDDLGRSQGSVINSNLVVDRLSPGAESWPARIMNDKTKILESARSSMMGMSRILVQSGSMPSSRSLAAVGLKALTFPGRSCRLEDQDVDARPGQERRRLSGRPCFVAIAVVG